MGMAATKPEGGGGGRQVKFYKHKKRGLKKLWPCLGGGRKGLEEV